MWSFRYRLYTLKILYNCLNNFFQYSIVSSDDTIVSKVLFIGSAGNLKFAF